MMMLPIDYSKVKHYWNHISEKHKGTYSVNYLMNKNDEIIARHRFHEELRFVLDNLPLGRKRFLDLACGTGNLTKELAKIFSSGEAVDFSHYSIPIARLNLKPFPKVKILCSDVLKYIYKGTYDLVNIAELLMYLEDKDVLRLLSKIRRHLRPESLIILRESVSLNQTTNLNRGNHQTIRRTLNHWNKIFSQAGYRVLNQKQNFDYNYAWMVGFYFGWLSKKMGRDKILAFFLTNQLTRFFFLFLPLKILMITKRIYCQYYFVLQVVL